MLRWVGGGIEVKLSRVDFLFPFWASGGTAGVHRCCARAPALREKPKNEIQKITRLFLVGLFVAASPQAAVSRQPVTHGRLRILMD